MTISPTETTAYTLTARNPDQETSQTVTVTVTVDRQVTILRFTAEPLSIAPGETATLVWEVRDATEVEISGIGAVDPQGGSMTISPTETTAYTLTARNPDQETSQTVTVTVTVDRQVTILRFTAEPPSIAPGETATLVWEARDATEVEISGIGAVDPQGGSVTISPDRDDGIHADRSQSRPGDEPDRDRNRDIRESADHRRVLRRTACDYAGGAELFDVGCPQRNRCPRSPISALSDERLLSGSDPTKPPHTR